MIKIGDADPVPLASFDFLPHSPTNNEDAALWLIDSPAAWNACFGPLLDPQFVLANFTLNAPSLGRYNIRLRCGTSSYGWHHIQQRHQREWQQRLDTANEIGPGPADTWDDLMALATAAVLRNPWWYTVEYDGKRCFTQSILVYQNANGQEIFRAWPTIVLSMSNQQVITSYPTSVQDCTRQAPWA